MKETEFELSEKAREAQRAYQREWRKKNKDKVKLKNKRYWEKQAAKMYGVEMAPTVIPTEVGEA